MAAERAEVDIRPVFSSVKEAVAVFGDLRLHTTTKPEAKPPPPPLPPLQTSWASSSPPPSSSSASQSVLQDELPILAALKKLEADMRETRRELLELKEKEAETEAAVAALDADVRRSVPRLAAAEINELDEASRVRSERWHEAKAEDLGDGGGGGFTEYLPTLAQAFSLVELEDDFGCWRRRKQTAKRRRRKKKKPVVPLIWDLFPKKKGSNYYFDDSSLYSRSFYSDLL